MVCDERVLRAEQDLYTQDTKLCLNVPVRVKKIYVASKADLIPKQ